MEHKLRKRYTFKFENFSRLLLAASNAFPLSKNQKTVVGIIKSNPITER